jgi:polyisoprenyl-phosphate glycosyltransferase
MTMKDGRDLLSIVIPAHNEEANIDLLHASLCAATSGENADFEIIFVDDGSRDDTRQTVLNLADRDQRVKLVALSRNFGHQSALFAGIEVACGDAVITMDCDLQHPPELIPDMIAAWRQGYTIVQMARTRTVDAGWGKRVLSQSFYRLMGFLSDTPITPDAADFNLLDRRAVESLLLLKDHRPFLRGMIAWLGYSHISLHYVAGRRASGASSYNFRRMLTLAVDAITTFSTKPLRVGFYIGCLAALASFAYMGFIAIAIISGKTIEGWTSLMTVLLFMGATQLMTVGIIGEYIGRIYDQTRGRPRYLVDTPQARRLQAQFPVGLPRPDEPADIGSFEAVSARQAEQGTFELSL